MDIWLRGFREYDTPGFVRTSSLLRRTIITECLILRTPPAIVGWVILRGADVIVIILCKSSEAQYVRNTWYIVRTFQTFRYALFVIKNCYQNHNLTVYIDLSC